MTKLRRGVAVIALSAIAAGTGAAGLAGWRTFTVSAAGEEIAPIAKYEFKDADNFGYDSMGNYHMQYRNHWMQDGTGPLLNNGTLIEGGGVEFSVEKDGGGNVTKGFCISQDKNNNMFEDVTAFTLAFELKISEGGTWDHYIGVGNSNGHDFNVHSAADGLVQARLAANGVTKKGGTEDMGGYWNSASLIGSATTDFQKIVISAQPGGQLRAWVNGTEYTDNDWMPAALPADWSPMNDVSTFSIGARWNGAADRCSVGAMKNVVVYNFAMDATCAAAYTTNGKVTADDIGGMKKITAITVNEADFTGGAATKVALNAAMTTDAMFAQLNEAQATLTLSEGEPIKTPVTWTEVVKEDTKYIAKGTVNTGKVGYVNTAAGGNAVSYELEVADIKSVGDPVFPENAIFKSAVKDSMTIDELLAAMNKATVTVTMGDESTQEIEVTFTRIENAMGKYTAYGDVELNGSVVSTVVLPLEIPVDNEGDYQELLPVAKWEFEDAANTGKDTMGNYNLGPVAREGGDLGNPLGMGTVQDGRLYLSGDDMLACDAMNDVGDNIGNGFTLNFQFQPDGLLPDRGAPVSFGFNDWSVSNACFFFSAGNERGLRIGAKDIAHSNTDDKNIFWGPVVLENAQDNRMHNVTLSVRPGEKFRVYVDGVQAFENDCPAGWTVKHSNMAFALGGSCVWGNGYDKWKGWLDNVSIYNFAMSLEQSNKLWEKGKIVVGDMDGEVVTSISQTPKFENDQVTNGKLTDALTDTQAIRRVNKATVDAVFANDSKVALNVTWKKLEKQNDKWYIVGEVDPSNIGYATILTGAQEVKQEVTVERVARTVAVAGASNGTVTVDKAEAYLGETVTITCTPAEGYAVDKVEVNGETIEAKDGVYSFVIEGIDNYEVSATFKVAANQGGDNANGEGGCGGCGSSLTLGIGGGIMLAGAALTVLLALKKKKD